LFDFIIIAHVTNHKHLW